MFLSEVRQRLVVISSRSTPAIMPEVTNELIATIDETFQEFDDETRQLMVEYLKQFEAEDQLRAIDSLIGMTWKQTPVGIREFITGAEYLNLVDTAGKPQIFPKIIDDLEEMFDGEHIEAIMTGGIGWGKSTFGKIVHAYMLHQLGCLNDPARAYGLATGSRIVLINLSIVKKNAEEIVFHQVQDMVDRSWWFQRYMPRKREKLDHLEFENNVWLAPFAANERAVVGFDAFGGIMDECNEMAYAFESTRRHRGEVVYDQAQTLRDALIRRMKNRFESVGLRLPGMLVQISSSKYPGEYTERRINEAKAGDTKIFWRQYSSWETAPWRYSSTTFYLALMTKSTPPFVIDGEVDTKRADDADAEIIEIPDNLKPEFDRDIHGAIRDFVGRSTASITPFIGRVDKLWDAFMRGKQARLEHPFQYESVTLLAGDTIDWSVFEKRFDPTKTYFAHGDLATDRGPKNDRAGIAIGHIAGVKLVVRVNQNGQEMQQLSPHYVIDFYVQIVAPTYNEIQISTIKAFFKELKSYGMRFAWISFDQWQSLSLIQDLTADRIAIEVEEFSVDRTNEPYQEYKDALYEDRIDMYENTIVLAETTALEKNERTGKVDHPPNGSKDVTDCIAAICFRMLQHQPADRPIMMKAHGPSTGDPALDRILQLREEKASLLGAKPESVRITMDDILFADAEWDKQ